MQRTIVFADCPLLGMLIPTTFRWAFLPDPLEGIFNRVLTGMETKVLIKMHICIPASARSFGGLITGLSRSSFIRAIIAIGLRIASLLLLQLCSVQVRGEPVQIRWIERV